MTKGIRAYAIARFAAHLGKLADIGGTAFRAKVMGEVQKKFDTTVASAATHYNHALKMTKLENPKAVEGLGRPEDKTGGPKPSIVVDVINSKTGRVIKEAVSRGKAQFAILAGGRYADGSPKLSTSEHATAKGQPRAEKAKKERRQG